MKDKVIQTAGKTWRILGEQGPTSIAQLAKILKEKDDIVNQAIGWLAREDKIKYLDQGSKTVISLIETEQQMYKVLKDNPITAKK